MEQREPQALKRKRIATACKTCQKKKIRCDGKTPCTYCKQHQFDCVFMQSGQRRGSRRGAKYIDDIEQRLKRMESLLNGSSVMPDTDGNQVSPASLGMQLDDSQNEETTLTAVPSPAVSSNHELPMSDVAAIPNSPHTSSAPSERSRMITDRDMDTDDLSSARSKGIPTPAPFMDPLAIQRIGENHYIGSLVGFSIFSPKGIEWVMEKTGNPTFKDAITAAARDDSMVEYWRTDPFSSIFSRQVFRPLPPKEDTISIVDKFFRDFNRVCPLFSQPLFMALVDRQYSAKPCDSVGWWASLNVVIAISLGLRALDNAPAAVLESSRDYLRNSLAVLTELTIRSTDLFAVQALLGMALLMQGTPDPRPSAFLLASAMRLSHTLGLHKQESLYNMDPLEAEQRKRVFWIAYRLDNDMCIRSGLPLMQDSDEMNLDLPSEHPEDELGQMTHPNSHETFNMFRVMAEFARIEARVHRQLYSTKALKQSNEELLASIMELDHQLEEWKESIPIEFQPEYYVKIEPPIPLSLHIIVLHFAYYHCLHTIHRTSIRHSSWANRSNHGLQGVEIAPLNPRVFQSVSLSISSARSSIRLIRHIPIQDHGFIWRVLYFPVNAFITLFSNVLQTTSGPRTRSDLRLMRLFVEFLQNLQYDDGHELRRVYRVCSEFERIARDAVDRTAKSRDQSKDQKWPNQMLPVANGFGFTSPSLQSSLLSEESDMLSLFALNYELTSWQSFPSNLDDSGMGVNLFSHAFPGIIGGTLDPYGEVQPMFPNGLTMPWNGNTFHGPCAPEPHTTDSLGFPE